MKKIVEYSSGLDGRDSFQLPQKHVIKRNEFIDGTNKYQKILNGLPQKGHFVINEDGAVTDRHGTVLCKPHDVDDLRDLLNDWTNYQPEPNKNG